MCTFLHWSARSTPTIDHTILCWLAELVGDLASKYLVCIDGKTGYERLFGKKVWEEQLEFGELVLWRKPRLQDYGVVAEARWDTGVWEGRRWSTPIHFFSFHDQVVECRAVQRAPKADRWKRDAIDAVRATRWANPSPAFDVAVPDVLPGTAPSCSSTTRVRSQTCVYPHGRPPEVGSYGWLPPLYFDDEWRASQRPRACRDRIEQAMKDDVDECFFAAEARLNRALA